MIVFPTTKIGTPMQTLEISMSGWWWKVPIVPTATLTGLYSEEVCESWREWVLKNWPWIQTFDVIILGTGNLEIVHYKTKNSCGNSIFIDIKHLEM